jgi:hypothetical protein
MSSFIASESLDSLIEGGPSVRGLNMLSPPPPTTLSIEGGSLLVLSIPIVVLVLLAAVGVCSAVVTGGTDTLDSRLRRVGVDVFFVFFEERLRLTDALVESTREYTGDV